MIKLIGKDKTTGAMVIENYAIFNTIGIFNFLKKLNRFLIFRLVSNKLSSGFDNILFWIETDKVDEQARKSD